MPTLTTPAEIDDAYMRLFGELAACRHGMDTLDQALSDAWMSMVEADREGRSFAALNASSFRHRDAIRARLCLTGSFTPLPAPASSSSSPGVAQSGLNLVNVESLPPSDPIIVAAATASAAAFASATSSRLPPGAEEDEDEYDFAEDDAEIEAAMRAEGLLEGVRDRRPAASTKSPRASVPSTDATDATTAIPAVKEALFTSAHALQGWFSSLPLPSLSEAQSQFVTALAAAVALAQKRQHVQELVEQLEKIQAEPFAVAGEEGEAGKEVNVA